MRTHLASMTSGLLAATAIALAIRHRRRFSIRHKTVFVTGGSRGLGLLLAHEFAARGANVAITARDSEELARAAAQLRTVTDQVLTIEADITMRDEAEAAVQ